VKGDTIISIYTIIDARSYTILYRKVDIDRPSMSKPTEEAHFMSDSQTAEGIVTISIAHRLKTTYICIGV